MSSGKERKGNFRTHKAARSLPLKHTEPHSSCSQLLQRVQSSSSILQHPSEQPRDQLNTPGYCPARVTSYRKHNGPSSVFLCKRPLRSLPTNPPAKRCCLVSVLTDQHPLQPPTLALVPGKPPQSKSCLLSPPLPPFPYSQVRFTPHPSRKPLSNMSSGLRCSSPQPILSTHPTPALSIGGPGGQSPPPKPPALGGAPSPHHLSDFSPPQKPVCSLIPSTPSHPLLAGF